MNILKINPEERTKLSITSNNFRSFLRKPTQRQTKKESKEALLILKEKNKVDNLKSKLNSKKEEIERYKEEINRLFKKSNSKETELKKYIAGLNSKVMNIEIKNIDRVDETYNKIIDLMGNIQEKIKMEINYTKQEMEKEVLYRFMDAEQKQQQLLDEKIEEQKRIIHKMNFTRQEIEKIRKLFEETNVECEMLTKENESLKITLQTFEEDNRSYNKKLKQIQRECKEMIKENKNLFDDEEFVKMHNLNLIEADEVKEKELDNLSMDENILDSSDENESKLQHHPNSEMGIKKHSHIMEKNNFLDVNKNSREKENNNPMGLPINNHLNLADDNSNNPEIIIENLKENIKSTKREFKHLQQTYTEKVSQRNEAQQLLQKCVEDVKFDISKIIKDITILTKKSNSLFFSQKLNEELKMKKTQLSSLENKLKILTFVYDNSFQTINLKTNNLISKIFKK